MISIEILRSALSDNQLTLSQTEQDKCIAYLEMMQKWNKVFNLTSITEPKDMLYKHLIDSLVIAKNVTGKNCLDVGSGAGLPGIPLAIINPEQKWTLLDKNNKKTRFLTQVVAELELSNVTIEQARCEDFKPPHKFDMILSRAYATLALFVQTTQHLLSIDGIFLAMKGKYPKDEIDALPENIELLSEDRVTMQGMNDERHLICLRPKP